VAIIPAAPIAKALGKNLDQAPVAPTIPDDVLSDLRARDTEDSLNIPEEEITVWHGTPHEFPAVTEVVSRKTGERVLVDKAQYPDWTQQPDIKAADYEFVKDHEFGAFDSSRIGTGEGAQAYGHGLYFAQRKGTAESYQKQLSSKITPAVREEYFKKGNIAEGFGGTDKVLNYNKGTDGDWYVEVIAVNADGSPKAGAKPRTHSTQPNVSDVESVLGPLKEGGNLYEVKIKANPEDFLDYDLPISEQSFYNKIVEKYPDEIADLNSQLTTGNANGGDVFSYLEAFSTPENTAKSLSNLGIKGIRYKDAQTRFSSKGATYNYVVFDDKIINIANKYGVSLFAAGSVSLGLMTPQQAQAKENPIGAPIPAPGTPESANDSTSSNYITYRQDSELTPSQLADIRIAAMRTEGKLPAVKPPASVTSTAGAIAKDVGQGLLEAPQAIVSGAMNAFAETQRTVDAIVGKDKALNTYDILKTMLTDKPDSVTGGLIEGISQFMTGFVTGDKALKALKVGAKIRPFAAGAVADATVFDAHEARLSDLVQEYPELQNPVTEYIQSDPEDSVAEGKFKLALEGLLLGGVAEVLVQGVKAVRGWKNIKEKAAEAGVTPEEFVGPMQEPNVPVARIGVDQEEEFIPFSEIADEASAKAPDPVKMGKGTSPDEAAKNINLNRLETTDEVKQLIEDGATANPLDVNNARRQVITQQETEALANDLGMGVEELLSRKGGEAFNAEQAVAARKLLVASGENLIKLAKVAQDGGDVAIAVFRRAMSQHRAIQLEVSGMTAEAGRALQSFRILASSGAEQQKAIKNAIDSFGGLDVNQDIARKMAGIKDVSDVGRFVKGSYRATTGDMVSEVWINSLLSAVGTHTMNIASNSSLVVMSVVERKVASVFGSEVVSGEASAMMLGIVEGARDGMKLARKAFATGEPSGATGAVQRQEVGVKRAITAEQLELSGPAGATADFIGNVVRVPGRALLAADEFFKAVAYRSELQAQAYRSAIREGLQGEDFVKRVQEILDNPPSDIKMASSDFALYQTFQNELGEKGKAVTKFRNLGGPFGAVLAPFIRTPLNVVKYASARTILAPFMKSFRADVRAGGAKRDLALARVAMGGMTMSIAALMAQSGQLTGNGPTDYNMRRIKEMSGWKPNSILIGDTYHSLERADPIAQVLLMAANLTEVMAQADDENDYLDVSTAAAVTIANGLTSKTFTNGIIDFVDAYASASQNPDDKQNAVTKWAMRLGSTVIPAGVAAISREMDPTLRLTNSLTDKIKARTPGYSKDLPPRRNMFGEPIVLEGGIGPDIMTPFYSSSVKENAVVDKMIENKLSIGMPNKSINGVELSMVQYDRFVQLSAGMDGKMPTLEKALQATMNSSQFKRATAGPDGMQNVVMKSVINQYRNIAVLQLQKEFPKLKSEIAKGKIENFEARYGKPVSAAQQSRMGVLAGEE